MATVTALTRFMVVPSTRLLRCRRAVHGVGLADFLRSNSSVRPPN